MRVVEVETRTGISWCTVRSVSEAQAHQERSREDAIRACLQLAEELADVEPQRAQRLRQVAEDPQRTTAERWGAYKDDDRQSRGQQAGPGDGDAPGPRT